MDPDDGRASESSSPSTRPPSPLFLTPSDRDATSLSFITISSTPDHETTADSPLFLDSSISDSNETLAVTQIWTSSLGSQRRMPVSAMPQTSTPVPHCCLDETVQGTSRTGTCTSMRTVDEQDHLEEPLPRAKRRRLFAEAPTTDQLSQRESSGSNSTNSTSTLQLSSTQALASTSMSCCSNNCLQHVSPDSLYQARFSFTSRKQSEQNQFLLDAFQLSNGDSLHVVAGKQVCTNGFIRALGISRKRYRRIHKQFANGSLRCLRKPPRRTVTEKTSQAVAWMGNYFEKIADRMPHTGHLHLPQFLTKKDVYNTMQ